MHNAPPLIELSDFPFEIERDELALMHEIVGRLARTQETIAIGIVHKYSPRTRKVDVRLKSMISTSTGPLQRQIREKDILRNVPVAMPGGGRWWSKYPIYDEFNAGGNTSSGGFKISPQAADQAVRVSTEAVGNQAVEFVGENPGFLDDPLGSLIDFGTGLIEGVGGDVVQFGASILESAEGLAKDAQKILDDPVGSLIDFGTSLLGDWLSSDDAQAGDSGDAPQKNQPKKDTPLVIETGGGPRGPDVGIVLFTKHPLRGLLEDRLPHMTDFTTTATFDEDNAVFIPNKFWFVDDGHYKDDHTYKLKSPKVSALPNHCMAVEHEDEKQFWAFYPREDPMKPLWYEAHSPTRINWVEEARFNVPFGPNILAKYNGHGHPKGQPGNGFGPPPDPTWAFCEDLSQTVYVDTAEESVCTTSAGEEGFDLFEMIGDLVPDDISLENVGEWFDGLVDSIIPDFLQDPLKDFFENTLNDVIDMGVDLGLQFLKDSLAGIVPIDQLGALLDIGKNLLAGDFDAALGDLMEAAVGVGLGAVGLGGFKGMAMAAIGAVI